MSDNYSGLSSQDVPATPSSGKETIMAQTVNGWPVIFHEDYDGPGPHLRKWYFPAGNGLTHHEKYLILRDGAIGFVLMHFFLWFHETIERIDVQKLWDEWGWAVRPVRGQTTGYSNHAGGAAGDINATVHPRGVSIWRTFKSWQIFKIRARVKLFYRGIVIWGGDWSIPDGMHGEIARVPMNRVQVLARRLAKTPRGQRILKANPGVNKNFP